MADETLVHMWTRFSIPKAEQLTTKMNITTTEALYLLHACMESAPKADLEIRLIALVHCMTGDPVTHILDAEFVRLVVSKRMFRLFAVLNELTIREIGIQLTLCSEKEARATINAAFALGLVDTAGIRMTVMTVMETVLSNARTDVAKNLIQLIMTLFDTTLLHTRSGFMKELKTLLLPHHSLLEQVQRSQKELLQNPGSCSYNVLSYKHVDLTAAAGSKWLRALVLDASALDEEERDFALSLDDAMLARLSHFAKIKKRTTKQSVLTAVVDGRNLFDFVVYAADTSTVSMLLLDAVVYCVTQEFPDLLPPTVYNSGFATLRERGMYTAFVSSRYTRTLVSRAQAFIDRTTAEDVVATLDALRHVVASGLAPSTITLFLCVDETLKRRDVVAWRALLKHCLAEFPVTMDVAYDTVFKFNQK